VYADKALVGVPRDFVEIGLFAIHQAVTLYEQVSG